MTTDTLDAPFTGAPASNNALTVAPEARDVAVMPGFNSQGSWELANRIGKAFAASSLVPQQYQGNVANCIVALEMANRMGASPLMVMQNLYIVHGTPGWSSKFLIACFNQCGRFSSLRYDWNQDRTACRAWAIEKATGERIEGPMVSLEIAKAEGWSTKNGSKWRTMPELMLMYRAAAFLIRTYAPEISMGLQTEDEIVDITPVGASPAAQPAGSMAAVRALLSSKPLPPAQPAKDAAAYMAEVVAAKDSEVAALVLDEARSVLGEEGAAPVAEAWRAQWGAQ